MTRRIDVQIILALVLLVGGFLLGTRLNGGGGGQKAATDVHSTTAGSGQETSEGSGGEAQDTIWTCSMHPQIQLPNPGKCPICGMDLIPMESKGGSGPDDEKVTLTMSKSAYALAEIETAPVVRGVASHEVRMVGKIESDETRVKSITAWIGGRLDRLFVDYTGVEVHKGDPLVWIYSPDLVSAQEELLQALQTKKELSASTVGLLKETAEQTIESSRDKLRLLGLSDQQIAEIEASGKAKDHITIYAPDNGVVVRKRAVVGDYVKTGQIIYDISDLRKLWVFLEAYESDLVWLHLGQEVTFTAQAYPGRSFKGRISFIDPVLDERTRTAGVRVEVDNSDGSLKPGVFVHGVVQSVIDVQPGHEGMKMTTKPPPPLLIPASAPLITGKRAIVYVRIPDTEIPRFEGREVILGPRAGDRYVVVSGLQEGELVVVNGAFKIDSAMQIQAKPSMMSPEGGTPPPNPHAGMDMGDDSSMDGKGE